MDLSPLQRWQPPAGWRRLTVIDSHAGGEPFRVVTDGLPDIPGDTMLERRAYAMEHLDDLRRILMWEPRGHADMYGGWLGDPVEKDSHLSVLFTHNEGFSTMCGHGVIALTKVAIDSGLFPASGGTTTLVIDTPAGQVTSTASLDEGKVIGVRFLNVPSFVVELDARVLVPGVGEVVYDLAFGGAFYAYVEAEKVGVSLSDAAGLVAAGRAIKQAIAGTRTVEHPENADLGFLYGVIFTGPAARPGNHSRNVCVFADGEVDRSPTGTGVSGRMAILHARGDTAAMERGVTIESILGSEFVGHMVKTLRVGPYPAIVPQVTGTAHMVGRTEMWVDPADALGGGFLVR